MKRIFSLAAATFFALGMTAGASAQNKPDGGNAQFRVQEYTGSILGIPMWVAIDKGFCKKYNLRCATVQLASGPLALQALAAGSIQASFASNDVNLMAASRGNDIQLVVGHTPTIYYHLDVRKGYPMPNRDKGFPAFMKDFSGAKVGVTARGSGVEMLFRALMKSDGMTGNEVTYVAVGSPATSYPTMLAGKIDATVSFEPFNTLCVAEKTCVDLMDLSRQGPPDMLAMNGGYASFAMAREYVEKHPNVVKAFIAAIEDADAWIKDPKNFDELLADTRKHISLGDIQNANEVMAQLVKGQVKSVGPAIERRSVDAVSDFLVKYGLIQNPVSSSSVVYAGAPK